MPKEDVQQNNAQALDAKAVAEYLEKNPSFFEQHADLLTDVKLQHSSGGA
ncbi:DUF484 family protein, partial [Gammaproteobacteria bacterium]|nr:DUF484 family protein [Gammaproteobacteria bacterium]